MALDIRDPAMNTEAPEPARSKRRRVPRGYESVDAILLTEPRIEAIRRQLQAMLRVVQLEVNGEPVEVDAFRLRDMRHWADYGTSLSDIFWHMSSTCNFGCEFCYEKGNPPDFPIQNLTRMASPEEVDTRLRYYNPKTQRGIFTTRTAINEPFVNRNAANFLPRLREAAPDELLSFITNGSFLSEEVVKTLADVAPVFFNLSLYSTDESIRRKVLNDRRPQTAVASVPLLRKYEVPFMANIVMWPSISFDDMARTIRFLDENRATVIRVCLGGYSRYLEGEFERFDPETFWPKVVLEVDRLRPQIRTPILIEPNCFVDKGTDALVAGVIADSPADIAGIRRGDIVVSVDGTPVRSRMHLMTLLRRSVTSRVVKYRQPGVVVSTETTLSGDDCVTLTIARDDATFTAHLDKCEAAAMATYPYSKIANFKDFVYGLVISDTLRYSSLREARRIVDIEGSKKPLLLTSVMIRPILEEMIAKTDAFGGVDVTIRVAKNRYFGGSIAVGDLLVVSDFIAAIQEASEAAGTIFDLVLIPESAFASSPWGRDLTGRPWTDIERKCGVPVRLVPCPTITF